ncbi:class I SAM-dependent methyltransferase [Pseudenhygromyxa sp. WMMC2535]|uniref:class I SAM-dependent methyltransferase n=1 Tax=Pseudenhygromyxa sp. WMMC2535 TaxID=2712867 RepID=UPI001553B62A|nr:class I SAM-dependent methyltransferase [Pseudenhygromyxa sp. WMMC2535]NVB40961.1 class I SAM-dependent methyltransferase [Pseudenhygromyxa sp. WMMC2535]
MAQPVPFDEAHAARYDEQFRPLAAFRDALHLVTQLALDEAPAQARVLCVGAGTGAEVLELAPIFPGWQFTAVDTSEPMLARCRARLVEAGLESRCELHAGTLDSLPPRDEPFDVATAVLVSHFLVDEGARRAFFRGIAERMRPGAPLIFADLAADALDGELMQLWKRAWRHAGATDEAVAGMVESIGESFAVLAPGEIETLVAESGFGQPVRVFQALCMHGWLARRAH